MRCVTGFFVGPAMGFDKLWSFKLLWADKIWKHSNWFVVLTWDGKHWLQGRSADNVMRGIEQVKMGPIIHLQPTNSSEPDCFSNMAVPSKNLIFFLLESGNMAFPFAIAIWSAVSATESMGLTSCSSRINLYRHWK